MANKIGLLWHSLTCDNLGVGALTVSHMVLLDRAARKLNITPRYKIIGSVGGMNYHDCISRPVEEETFSLREFIKNPAKVISKFDDCQVVFDLGEGDSFADIYGLKRFSLQMLGKLISLKKGLPLVLAPQTIGPFTSGPLRFLAKEVIRRSVKVFPRDGLSFSLLQQEGVDANAVEVIDLAFALPFNAAEKFSESDGKVHVGVNVSGLLFNGGYNKKNQFGLAFEYRDFINQLLSSLVQRDDLVVHLVPHVITDQHEIEDDYRASIRIRETFPSCRIAPKFGSPVEAKSYISRFDFFVGSRMHATIAAFSSGVPVVPIAYSRKFQGLFNSLHYTWVVDATRAALDETISTVETGIDNRKQLYEQVCEGNVLAEKKLQLYESFLEEYLSAALHC